MAQFALKVTLVRFEPLALHSSQPVLLHTRMVLNHWIQLLKPSTTISSHLKENGFYLKCWITVKDRPSLNQCHSPLSPWWMMGSEGHLFPFLFCNLKFASYFKDVTSLIRLQSYLLNLQQQQRDIKVSVHLNTGVCLFFRLVIADHKSPRFLDESLQVLDQRELLVLRQLLDEL